jgi:beta-galactosidase GanA
VEDDIRLMLDAGLNVARIGEFAWSSIEPEEGRFELEWLRRVVDKLGEAGIATIMCTPTCTPPAWLTGNYPEVLAVGPNGVRTQHGARRHVCPNNPVYREHCARITTRLGESFGHDDRVIGWQIDNEVNVWEGRGCFCDVCVARFRESLQRSFETVDALNAAWGTALWSQTYQSFSQVPPPRPDVWHHPSLLAAWAMFQNASVTDYVALQAAILHKTVVQPVGTDMMPTLEIGYEPVHRHLDLVQYNHYDTMDNLWRQVFWMDYVRPLKKAPFWNTETATCWNGGVTANGYKDPGFCRANSWLPISLGGEANLYWLWRSHWSGQELMHGAVVSSCGRPLHMIDEVREVSRGFRACASFLNGTRPAPTGLAMHVSTLACTQFRYQSMVQGFDYLDYMIDRVYRSMMDAHLRADIIDPAASLDPYRVVFSPFLPTLDESGLRQRLHRWIENGGTWIVGPLSDVRTLDGTKPTHAPFVCLEEWAGVRCKFEVPGNPRDFTLAWHDGGRSTGSLWYSGFETANAEILATYADGPLEGLAALTETSVGEGRIVLLGTLLRPQDLQGLLLRLSAQCDIRPAAEATPNVLVVPRKGEAGEGVMLVELHNQRGTVTLQGPAKDLLTGKTYSNTVEVGPYEVMVLQFDENPAGVAGGGVLTATAET